MQLPMATDSDQKTYLPFDKQILISGKKKPANPAGKCPIYTGLLTLPLEVRVRFSVKAHLTDARFVHVRTKYRVTMKWFQLDSENHKWFLL